MSGLPRAKTQHVVRVGGEKLILVVVLVTDPMISHATPRFRAQLVTKWRASFHITRRAAILDRIKKINPHPSPKISDEFARVAKHAIFPSVKLGWGGGRGSLNVSFELSEIVAV